MTAYTGKCELGQGMMTAQIQLIAEELSVPVARVRLVQCDTSMTPDQGTTSGSQSSPTNFNKRNLALAAATAREALLQRGVGTARRCRSISSSAADGAIVVDAPIARSASSYGELVGGQTVDDAAQPRRRGGSRPASGRCSARRFRASTCRRMATGQFEFVHNVRVDGMVHGARRPSAGGRRHARERRRAIARWPAPA